MQYRENYLEEEVLARAQREYMHRVPVTPKESAAWVGLCAPSSTYFHLLFSFVDRHTRIDRENLFEQAVS
jgi:hypothetical protein